MKNLLIISIFLLITEAGFSQVKTKQTSTEKAPTQSEMDKMMEDAMKGMSDEEKAEMKKMMKDVMPALSKQNANTANYPEFTSNKQLVPKKDIARINAIPKKKLIQTDMVLYAANLYNKIMTKGNAAEIAIVKKVVAKSPAANDLGSAAILCMMQGHPLASMALSMKAVQADPKNVNWQNNMASLLTQYGYPEQAIPVLEKLRTDFPDNSTVLNNLAMAWFNLGEIDSTKAIIRIASRNNPENPDAQLCGGLMEELFGDPKKANDNYTEAIEHSPDPFTESMLKNNNGQNKMDNLDFEKLKRSIAIHEYFPKDWIKIPKLSDKVTGYESDMAIKNGYQNMFDSFDKTIKALEDASMSKINSQMNDDATGNTFVTGMAKEMMNGYSFMSKPATIVTKLLTIEMGKWALQNGKDAIAMMNEIDAKRKQMNKSGQNDKCADFDRRNTEFLQFANPLIRQYYKGKIEEFRTLLNAFCTWIWFIDGNPENSALTQCIVFTEGFKDLLMSAVLDQETIEPSCFHADGDKLQAVTAPEIPNFSCPATVSIPFGKDWQDLSKGVKDFDANSLGITKAPGVAVPNTSIAYGASKNNIAQPGVDPSTKTSNGSIVPNHMTKAEAAVYHQETMDLIDALPNFSEWQHKKNMQMINGLKPWAQIVAEKALLKKYLTADCENKKKKPEKMTFGLGELMIQYYDPRSNRTYECKSDKGDDMGEADFMKKAGIIEMKQVTYDGKEYWSYEYADGHHELMPSVNGVPGKSIFCTDLGELVLEEIVSPPEKTDHTATDFLSIANRQIHQFEKDYETNGLLPTLSTSPQAIGTFTPITGLFK